RVGAVGWFGGGGGQFGGADGEGGGAVPAVFLGLDAFDDGQAEQIAVGVEQENVVHVARELGHGAVFVAGLDGGEAKVSRVKGALVAGETHVHRIQQAVAQRFPRRGGDGGGHRSEEHTSELQSR